MAIHTSNKIESTTGFQKEIDLGSQNMLMDIAQKDQYQFPEKSVIRELTANAVDSVKERDIAKLILSGKAKIEDYYIEQEGSEFKDSKFNANYFSLRHLSTKSDVEIIYKEGKQNELDTLSITDYGVGLGGNRLALYFRISGSTKRNSKSAIGKYGVGKGAPLATGVVSYRLTTVYNGYITEFDIYEYKVDPVTPKFAENGQTNEVRYLVSQKEGVDPVAYYVEPTTELNRTTISLNTKRFNRGLYTDAVRQQLLYFDNVLFKKIDENGYEQTIPTKANVIYEDDDIILADNNQYSKPHVIINKICYGPINFLHLELEDKQGNIGIKMNAENIDISSSREVLKWTDKTRLEVTKKFEKVQEIASKEVEKQLNEKDFGQWLVKCSNVLAYGNSSNDILGRLSRVIDKSGLKPTYPGTGIKYKTPSELLYGVQLRWVISQQNYNNRTGKTSTNLTRENISSWNQLKNGLYYTIGNANNTKDRFLNSIKAGFVLLTLPEIATEEAYKEVKKNDVYLTGDKKGLPINLDISYQDYLAKMSKQTEIIDLLISSNLATNYDELVVPEDFLKKLEANEKEVGEGEDAKVVELTPAEKRKLDERIVCYYPKWTGYALSKSKSDGSSYNTFFTWEKHEPKIKEVNDWENVIYCFSDEDEQLLTTAWLLMQQQKEKEDKAPTSDAYFSDYGLKLVRIAKGLAKHFKQFTHVEEFYKKVKITKNTDGSWDHTLNMNNLLVKWYTGKLIAEGLESVKFLANFSAFNQDIAEKYNELKTYQAVNYVDLGNYYKQNLLGCTPEAFTAITGFADKVLSLQLLVDSDTSAEDIKTQSTALFNEELTGAQAVDLDMYKKLQEVIEYATPLKNIMSYMPILADSKSSIPYELESEIKDIMRNKGY